MRLSGGSCLRSLPGHQDLKRKDTLGSGHSKTSTLVRREKKESMRDRNSVRGRYSKGEVLLFCLRLEANASEWVWRFKHDTFTITWARVSKDPFPYILMERTKMNQKRERHSSEALRCQWSNSTDGTMPHLCVSSVRLLLWWQQANTGNMIIWDLTNGKK